MDVEKGVSPKEKVVKLVPEVDSGTLVRFKLANVVCPETEVIVEKITDQLEVRGRIVFLSDAGERDDHFAIVEVQGIMSPLIVPVEQVAAAGTDDQQNVARTKVS